MIHLFITYKNLLCYCFIEFIFKLFYNESMCPIIEEAYSVQIERDQKSGQVISETWCDEQGHPHRTGDFPAVIHYDLESGKPVQLEYYFHGDRHRSRGPSFIMIDPVTDVRYQEIWELYGRMGRQDDNVVMIKRDRTTGEITYTENFDDPLMLFRPLNIPSP